MGLIGSTIAIRVEPVTPVSARPRCTGPTTVDGLAPLADRSAHGRTLPTPASGLFRAVIFVEAAVTVSVHGVADVGTRQGGPWSTAVRWDPGHTLQSTGGAARAHPALGASTIVRLVDAAVTVSIYTVTEIRVLRRRTRSTGVRQATPAAGAHAPRLARARAA